MDNGIYDGFPCYYPNGDYFLFLTTDLKKGILGVPGFGEIEACMFVIGEGLIYEVEKQKAALHLKTI
ncbi:MAG: DUF2716 domain-containing protein [Clostridia bacterium]|nr:DUF2716 domain-containing protein [Clostridia bacterium]